MNAFSTAKSKSSQVKGQEVKSSQKSNHFSGFLHFDILPVIPVIPVTSDHSTTSSPPQVQPYPHLEPFPTSVFKVLI